MDKENQWQALLEQPDKRNSMNVLVTGATGYIGGRLVPGLLARGHRVRCLTRTPRNLAGRFPGATSIEGDVLEPPSLVNALAGMDAAYYLVHSMGTGGDFASRDRDAARNFAAAAKAAGLKQIIYLGGLGTQGNQLSKHLRSRHEVGDMLRTYGPAVTEFRAAIIVGSGSVSFEMIRYLTERLPVMIAPKWVSTRSQPIAVADVIAYLVAALERDPSPSRIYEIGGEDILSYREIMLRYARLRGLKRTIIDVPFFTPRLSSYWVHLVTPVPANIARPLIDGLRSEAVADREAALRDFTVRPMGCDEAIRRALDRYQASDTETTWFDAMDSRQLPGQFQGVTQGMLIDRRERRTHLSTHEVYHTFTSLGGASGWLYGDWLWDLRGFFDLLLGGVGMRRGRRSPSSLRVGDALDFWRVEALEPDRLMRLRAEMKTPGDAWLEFVVEPDEAGSVFRMTAYFEPRGLFGTLYWYAVAPLHGVVFGGLAQRIATQAA